jgi:hypothetical protein
MPQENAKPAEVTINEEAGLGPEWVPIDVPPIIPANPPLPSGAAKYQVASLPPGYQHDVSFVDSGKGSPDIPKLSLMPLGIQGNPATNAAIQSTASKTVQAAKAASAKIELLAPSIFVETDQTVTLPGPLVLDLAPELPNTFFAGPGGILNPGGADQELSFFSATNPLLGTLTPLVYPEFAICGAANWVGGSLGLDSSWSTSGSYFGGAEVLGYKSVSSGTCDVTINTGSPIYSCVAVMSLWKTTGLAPAVVQSVSSSAMTAGTVTLTFPSPVTSGNMVFIQITGSQGSYSGVPPIEPRGPFTVTDNVGNVYQELGHLASLDSPPGGNAFQCFISQWACSDISGGSLTITVSQPSADPYGYWIIGVAEFSNIQKIPPSAIPTFRRIVPSDLPVFGPSGPSHSVGAVPDPGSTAGVVKYLREDATWVNPTGGGSSAQVEVNGVLVSSDKIFYMDGVQDGAPVWGVAINGASQ